MQPDRIAQLLEPFLIPWHSEASTGSTNAGGEPGALSPTQLQSISTHIDILLRWNARINLTAVRAPDKIVTRHFGESLFAARSLFPDESSANGLALADLGSGAGFPGLPIKLWAPHISLTLIESNHKKSAFLSEVVRALTLTNVYIHTARAETLPSAGFDLVTLRAVERFEAVLPIAAGLVAPGGRLALLVGAAQVDRALATLPDLSWSAPRPIPMSNSRVLIVGSREPAL